MLLVTSELLSETSILSPAWPTSVFWLVVVRCHFIYTACCFPWSLARRARWGDVLSRLHRLVSGTWGQSVAGYCRARTMVLRLRAAFLSKCGQLRASRWAPGKHLWADVSAGYWTGVNWNIWRGSAKRIVRENPLHTLGQIYGDLCGTGRGENR